MKVAENRTIRIQKGSSVAPGNRLEQVVERALAQAFGLAMRP